VLAGRAAGRQARYVQRGATIAGELQPAASGRDRVRHDQRSHARWPDLFLPKGIPQAWQEHHPELRTSAAA
jgi:hypothetical protein